MAKFILGAVLALVLAGCGGGADAPADPPKAPSSPPTKTCTPRVVSVALLGDSTMYGSQGSLLARAAHDPGAQLQADMDARFGAGAVIVTNYGVPGTYSSQAVPVKADVVVANYGINDMPGQNLPQFIVNMKAIGATLIETQNPIDVAAFPDDVQASYAQAARGLGLPVADTFAYVKSLPNWASLLADGTHPTDALYVMIVDNVLAPAVAEQVAPLRCQ
jgi:acyl-CoA thioesterase-1